MRGLVVAILGVGLVACDCRGVRLVEAFDAGCVAETCDGLDNDCDGLVDEDLGTQVCGEGECTRTVALCEDGAPVVCTPGEPSAEVCDGLDNDCNGLVDDGLADLTCGVGACQHSEPACADGVPGLCTPGEPSAEVCNGEDDDCNGTVDDGLGTSTCGVGACARTMTTCADGAPQACVPGMPSAEVCDGEDNDCNGIVDDGFTTFTCGVGACVRTVSACTGGSTPACVPGAPSAEVCDGQDNDCNGTVDDGLGMLSCGVGACARSVSACANGAAQVCTAGAPMAESCNGLDDDCNGRIDDGVCQPPLVTCPASLSMQVGTSVVLTGSATASEGTVASTSWTVTTRPGGSMAQPASPGSTSTSFTPDVAGNFLLTFCATDSNGRTACCTTGVSTSVCASPPAPPVSTECATSWDGRPIIQFAAVPVGLTYELLSSGSTIASAGAGSNWLRPATRIAAGGPPPGTPVSLGLRACRSTDPACCSSVTPVQVSVVETCASPVAPTSANIVLSEYLVNGEGTCPSPDCQTQDTCQAGEAIEITNLSNCPVALDGFHFAYRNSNGTSGSFRWMNFGAADVVPPRGVYVAIRNRQYAPTCSAPLGTESPAIFGLKVSALTMQGLNLCSGWFNNSGGGQSEMQVAPGTIPVGGMPSFTPAAAIARIAPYLSSPGVCVSVGFDAVDSCGTVVGGAAPTTVLSPNQLGRLWHPCDAVVNAVPACTY